MVSLENAANRTSIEGTVWAWELFKVSPAHLQPAPKAGITPAADKDAFCRPTVRPSPKCQECKMTQSLIVHLMACEPRP